MANKSLLNEAIAEAAEIREAALANAKAALEESFTPKLKELFSQKVQEMEKDEEDKVKKEAKKHDKEELKEMPANDYDIKSGESITPHPKKVGTSTVQEEEEDLDEVLAQLDEEMDDVDEGYGKKHDKDDMKEAEDDKDDMHEEEGEEEDSEESEEEDDDIDLDDISPDEFRDHVKDVIVKMIDDGEIEAGPEFEGDGEDMDMDMDGEIEIDDDSEEMAIAAEGEEGVDKLKVRKEGKKHSEEEMMEAKEEELDEAKKEDKDDEEMKEALETIENLKSELNEVNLLNAKLLYANKIFRNKNLSESKKVKVLESFDNASTVKEAKLVYETLNEGITTKTVSKSNRPSVKRMASKPMNVIKENKQPIVESNDMVARFQKLAGIN